MARIKHLKNPEDVPKDMQLIFNAIVELTDPFCKLHLNEEYADVSRKLAAALCRKRQSPLLSGHINTWAASVVYVIGSVNFLFDRSKKPYISANDLCNYFGISKSTAAAKSKQIRDIFGINQLDPQWTLPSRVGSNPMAWLIQVDGFLIDARQAPLQIQLQAFAKGFIPYVPLMETNWVGRIGEGHEEI